MEPADRVLSGQSIIRDPAQIEDMITQGIMQDYVNNGIDTFIAPPRDPDQNEEKGINFLSRDQGQSWWTAHDFWYPEW